VIPSPAVSNFDLSGNTATANARADITVPLN